MAGGRRGWQIRSRHAKNASSADREIRDRTFHRFQLKSTMPVAFLATGSFTAAGCGDGAWRSFSVSSG
jgi:hypothetical protein